MRQRFILTQTPRYRRHLFHSKRLFQLPLARRSLNHLSRFTIHSEKGPTETCWKRAALSLVVFPSRFHPLLLLFDEHRRIFSRFARKKEYEKSFGAPRVSSFPSKLAQETQHNMRRRRRRGNDDDDDDDENEQLLFSVFERFSQSVLRGGGGGGGGR